MLDTILTSITSASTAEAAFSGSSFLICTLASIILGCVAAAIYMYKNTYNKNFVMTLAILPLIVQIVIILVNGNLGAGVAVMGAFNLVRFRSIPGGSKEIGSIFLAMATGLATGMGYIGVAALLILLYALLSFIYSVTRFGEEKSSEKELKITIPEELDYSGVFDDVFTKYTQKNELIKVKTSNMGSLYQLSYIVKLKDNINEKSFIDELRCRNGNLEIMCGRVSTEKTEL